VVVTPFNPAYPLIRLGTGDLSAIETEMCACGRTSRKLKGILGRVDNTAKVKGQFVYPSQAQAGLKDFPRIESWQLEINNPGGRDTLALYIKAKKEINKEEVAAALQKAIKLRPEIKILSDGEDLPQDAPQLVDKRKYD
jgi:phenylacetate-CoA ligase